MKRLLLLAAVLGAGCGVEKPREVMLATKTSVQDTGLQGELLPAFQAKTGIAVKPVAVGSREAIAMARRGEADVVLAHRRTRLSWRRICCRTAHPDAEFLPRDRPADDPAGSRSPADAFRAIATRGAAFVTRGDQSGTHKKELAL